MGLLLAGTGTAITGGHLCLHHQRKVDEFLEALHAVGVADHQRLSHVIKSAVEPMGECKGDV